MSRPKPTVLPVKLTDIREKDEYIAEAERITDMYRDKPKPVKPGNVGPVKSLREKILMMSLFPNVFRPAQHHRTFPNMRTEDDDGENYVRHRTAKERKDGLDF